MSKTFVPRLAATLGLFLFGAIATSGQTLPTSITDSPTNPLIGTGQTQQFTTLSATPLAFGQASAISAGADHTCALLPNGTVQCLGYNYYGQRGSNFAKC